MDRSEAPQDLGGYSDISKSCGDESLNYGWIGQLSTQGYLRRQRRQLRPEFIWDTLEPFLEPNIGAGALFKTARGEADKVMCRLQNPKTDAVRKGGRRLFNKTPQ